MDDNDVHALHSSALNLDRGQIKLDLNVHANQLPICFSKFHWSCKFVLFLIKIECKKLQLYTRHDFKVILIARSLLIFLFHVVFPPPWNFLFSLSQTHSYMRIYDVITRLLFAGLCRWKLKLGWKNHYFK